jgi:hypothetical protein
VRFFAGLRAVLGLRGFTFSPNLKDVSNRGMVFPPYSFTIDRRAKKHAGVAASRGTLQAPHGYVWGLTAAVSRSKVVYFVPGATAARIRATMAERIASGKPA